MAPVVRHASPVVSRCSSPRSRTSPSVSHGSSPVGSRDDSPLPWTRRASPETPHHTGEPEQPLRHPPRPMGTKHAVPQARRPPRERPTIPYSDKVGARLQHRAKASIAKLNALGDLTSEESEALYAAFHRHDVQGEVDKASFVLLWTELKESEPLIQQRPPPTAAHSLLSSAAFDAIYTLLRSRGRLSISIVEQHLEQHSIFLPMNLATVDTFVDNFPETFQVSERLVGGRPGHRLVCLTEAAATGSRRRRRRRPTKGTRRRERRPSSLAALPRRPVRLPHRRRIELLRRCWPEPRWPRPLAGRKTSST